MKIVINYNEQRGSINKTIQHKVKESSRHDKGVIDDNDRYEQNDHLKKKLYEKFLNMGYYIKKKSHKYLRRIQPSL